MYDITGYVTKNNFLQDPMITRLVSYPRTGSHWFRVLMEMYLEKPSGVRSFYYPNPKEIWGIHIHNRDVDIYEESEGIVKNLDKVIYLHRNPCDTLFSLLKYEKIIAENWNGSNKKIIEQKVIEYSHEYKKHLVRWTENNNDIKNIFYLKYENLKDKPHETFESVLKFMNLGWNHDKFSDILSMVDKKRIKNLTLHDPSVISMSQIFYQDIAEKQKLCFYKHYKDHIEAIFGDKGKM